MKRISKSAPVRCLTIALAGVLAFTGVGIAGIAPSEAHAVVVPRVGDTVYGTCYIADTWMIGSQSYFNVSDFTGELADAWVTSTIECCDHTAAEPSYVGASYAATVSSIDLGAGTVEYYVYITPPGVTDGHTSNELGLVGYQHIGGYMKVARAFIGWVDLQKASANPNITKGNSSYSLASAKYGVYDSQESAKSDSPRLQTLATDVNGYALSSDLTVGTYWVKEQEAPQGYALDPNIYEIQVRAGETARVNGGDVFDKPQSNPVSLVLGKIDRETKANIPQGSASLAGAHFKINYYAGFYSISDASWIKATNPTRTWVLKTNETGSAELSERFLVSGDPLYFTQTGTVTLPLGTITIQEVKAPEGYLLDDSSIHIQQISEESNRETIESFKAPTIEEQVKRGDHRITKEVPTTTDPEQQEMTRQLVEGVRFEYYNDNENAVLSPSEKLIPKGALVLTTQSNQDGDASTKDLKLPQGWTGALAYGTYIVHEVIPQEVIDRYKTEQGITLTPVDDWKITISEEEQYDAAQLVANRIPQTPLKISKKDAISGKVIPLNCSFQIYDSKNSLVTYTDRYAEQTIDTWRTGNDGELSLPMKLDEGSYRIVEVEAPEGYVLNPTGIEFTVDEYRTWDKPLVIEYFNNPIMAEIEVLKTDSTNGQAVGGAEYTLRAASDIVTGDGTLHYSANAIVAAGLETDAQGYFKVEGLHLGRYKIYETKAPRGYALDTKEHLIEIESSDQTMPLVLTRKDFVNEPTSLRVLKTDRFTSAPLEGATYHVWLDEPSGQDSFNDESPVSQQAFNYYGTSDSTGVIHLPYLVSGSYRVLEIEAPEGYVLPKDLKPVEFFVDEQGLIEGAALLEIKQDNHRIDLKTFAFDRETGSKNVVNHETATIVDTVSYENLIIGKSYTISGILMDQSTGRALLEEGQEIRAEKTFEAKESKGSIDVEFSFNASSLQGNKLVVFEDLYEEGVVVAQHHDLNDEEQTVEIVEIALHTLAFDKETSSKTAFNRKETTIIDSVSYVNVIAGKEYRLSGVLMDKFTSEPLIVNGEEVQADVTFVPNETHGTIDLEFDLDASALAGKEVVVFEKLSDTDSVEALHEDINDKGQSVTIVEAPQGTPFVQTGDTFYSYLGGLLAISFGMLVVAGMYGIFYRLKRRR